MDNIMYDASVRVFLRAFANLGTLLDKAEAASRRDAGLTTADLVDARLAPDMRTFAGQIQSASDTAKFCVARLTGEPGPSFPDTETSFPELRERIAKTVAYLETLTPAQFQEAATRAVVANVFGKPTTFVGQAYLLTFALPNFFFHMTTAYALLRHRGVDVGKADYLGRFDAGAA